MTKCTVYKPLTVTLLFLISFTVRLIALYQTPYANGWDGYYYIMQMYTFVENGTMRAPDYSLIYPFYIALYYITNDLIISYKIGSAVLAATFTATIYVISHYLITNKQSDRKAMQKASLLALIIGLFSIFSPTLTYYTAQFPKNLLGIIFLLWFIYFINKKNVIVWILFFVLAYLTHRMTAGLAIIILIISLLKRKNLWILITTGIIGIIGLSLLPGIIHISDIERFKETIDINFPLYELIKYFGIDRISVLWIIEVILSFLVFLFFAITLINKYLNSGLSSSIYIHIFIVSLILCLPVFQFESAGLGFRLFLSFNIIVILLFPVLLQHFSVKILIITSLIIISASAFSYKSYNPEKLDPPYKDYFQVVNELETKLSKDVTLVVAHQGLAQIIIIYSFTDATNWQPKKVDSNYAEMARIAANIPYYYYKKYLSKSNISKIKHLYKSYYLIPEGVWQQFKESVITSDNISLKEKIKDWYNPATPKPQYLLKGRKTDYIQ